jgi:hypothetical protein
METNLQNLSNRGMIPFLSRGMIPFLRKMNRFLSSPIVRLLLDGHVVVVVAQILVHSLVQSMVATLMMRKELVAVCASSTATATAVTAKLVDPS